MRQQPLQIFAVVVITVVGVRRGHHVRDAIGRSHAAHGNANIPRLGSVIYLGKNVRMNIDHNLWEHLYARGVALPSDLSRFERKEKASKRRLSALPDRS